MKRVFTIWVFALLVATPGTAQHQELNENPLMYKGKENTTEDSTSLLHAFKAASVHGHFRYFFSGTDNKKGLTDYYANAVGGGLRFETAKFYGFQMAISGFYIFNIGSSDFLKTDSVTGQSNRYEIGLFDVEDPANKKDLDRLEELYLKYNFKNTGIIVGRQLINTPFINLQDGRMRPTGVEGIWFTTQAKTKTKIEGGWLYAVSPRSTVKWYNTGESIGIYTTGINPDGTMSGYAGNIESKGVAMLGINTKINRHLTLQVWNLFTENVFNTAMLQADFNNDNKDGSGFFAAAQLIRQDAVNDGGNENPAKTYFTKGQRAITFGGKMGWKNKLWETSFNYNRITADGRYLMPREWGREPFFTFLPRERNEGLGDVHAMMLKVNYNIPKARVKTSFAAGYYQLPDVKDYRLNKYGMPSFTQLNADIRYTFSEKLEGFEVQLLLTGKIGAGNVYGNDKYVFNKVNMTLCNVVLNYHF